MRHSIDDFEVFNKEVHRHIVNGYIQEASDKYKSEENGI
jgi:hypothetical protein